VQHHVEALGWRRRPEVAAQFLNSARLTVYSCAPVALRAWSLSRQTASGMARTWRLCDAAAASKTPLIDDGDEGRGVGEDRHSPSASSATSWAVASFLM